ncbi:MAG TPA: biotin--[acetyl-CoA-carboxylase] ligase [Pirellulales bacterium]|nr:biotin--[acetyl-CoA-carboxylase] ligase [Pirellulales bacterium]
MSDLAEYNWAALTAAGLVDRAEYFASLGSTNDHAREIAAMLPRDERRLIVADEQTAGRGRGANRWWTAPGSLACSLLFDPAGRGIERQYFPMISLAAAIAIAETATVAASRVDAGLHWPNDVFIAGSKLAGVLIEALPDGRHVLGMGCNVNNRAKHAPPELSNAVVSLADLTGRDHSRGELLIEILRRLDERLDELARSPHAVGRRADELCLQHGKFLTIRSGSREASGMCAGIADDGALLLDTITGRQWFYSGVLVKNTDGSA